MSFLPPHCMACATISPHPSSLLLPVMLPLGAANTPVLSLEQLSQAELSPKLKQPRYIGVYHPKAGAFAHPKES